MLSIQTETSVINSVIEGATAVIPMQLQADSAVSVASPYEQSEIGVLIGMTGDVRGRLIMDASKQMFGAISEKMFGMVLSGEMLDSFAGELGNMISGHMAIKLSEQSIKVDITPPTVLVGNTKLKGFAKASHVSVIVEEVGNLNFTLILED